jgi:hypothetical protein
MRVAVSDINAFVALADARAETFRETFAHLIRLSAAKEIRGRPKRDLLPRGLRPSHGSDRQGLRDHR